MVSTLILFGKPEDPAAFEDHFSEVHHPLLLGLSGLKQLRISRVAGAAHGDASLHVLVELEFASEEAMQEALNSESGQAMARDLRHFATGGVEVLFARSDCDP